MSPDQADSVRAYGEAFNRRDADALTALLADDVLIRPFRAALEPVAYRGPEAPAAMFAAVEESWERMTAEVNEVRVEGDCALGFGRVRGVGRASGVSIDAPVAVVARFRDGLITEITHYTNIADAVADAGFSGAQES